MQVRNFRSLDQPSSMFGVKGKFIYLPACGGGVGLLLAFIIGSRLGTIVGLLVFLLCVGVGYGVAMILQSRISERELMLTLTKYSLPSQVIVHPKPFREYLDEIDVRIVDTDN